jgi:hypothetical protein
MLAALLSMTLHAVAAPASLDESARVLAALPVPEGSALQPVTKSASWQASRATMDKIWNDYVTDDLAPIRTWAKQELGTLPEQNVFYPFSGPDILNAIAFYPQGNDYVLMGLERIGSLPSYEPGATAAVTRDIELTRQAMSVVLDRGYFITSYMSNQVGNSPTTGVAGLLAWFLVRTDHELLSGRMVTFDAKGQLVGTDAKSTPTGVEIRFRKRGETKEHTVWYFRGDLSDDSFVPKRKALVDFITSKGQVHTLLKAASYLMFNREFDDMRALVLARSTTIVSDDSGMPWHFVAKPGWETRLYGTYQKPIADFAGRCQPELQQAVTARSRGAVPFDFGYTWKKPHLVLSLREPSNPVGAPTFDRSNRLGVGVGCWGGKSYVR